MSVKRDAYCVLRKGLDGTAKTQRITKFAEIIELNRRDTETIKILRNTLHVPRRSQFALALVRRKSIKAASESRCITNVIPEAMGAVKV